MPKPPALFQAGVDFALDALDEPKSKITYTAPPVCIVRP